MNDDELRKAYQSRRAGASDATEPAPEELRRLVAREGDDAERLAILDRALSSRKAAGDLELLRAIFHAGRSAGPRRWWHSPVPLAIAASLVVVAAGVGVLSLRARAGDQPRAAPADGAPVLVAPGTDARVADSVRFVWQAVPGAKAYRVELLTDAGTLVTSIATADTFARYAPIPGAGTGLAYRWVVVALLPEGVEIASRPRRLTITAP